MAEIDTSLKYLSVEKEERIATVLILCVRIIVLTLCYIFLTTESLVEDFESAVAYLVMWPFVMVIFIMSIYRTGRAISDLYKHR